MRIIKASIIFLSFLFNAIILIAYALYLHRMSMPNTVTASDLEKIIINRSWNSAGYWRVVSQSSSEIILQYTDSHPALGFTRFRVSKDEFYISANKKIPFDIGFNGCDISSKQTGKCVNFRRLDVAPECWGF